MTPLASVPPRGGPHGRASRASCARRAHPLFVILVRFVQTVCAKPSQDHDFRAARAARRPAAAARRPAAPGRRPTVPEGGAA